MKNVYRPILVIAVVICMGCESSRPEPEPRAVPISVTSEGTSTKRSKESSQTGQASAKATLAQLPFNTADVPEGLVVKGRITDGLRWKDRKGENFILFSEDTIPAPKQARSGEQGPGRLLYATHYVIPGQGGAPLKLRTIKDRYASCGFDLVAHFKKTSFRVTDLDGDGIGEASFAYLIDCTSDVSPLTQKLILLEGGEKYILRGQSRVSSGPGHAEGGEFTPGSNFKNAPAIFQGHARTLWKAITGIRP